MFAAVERERGRGRDRGGDRGRGRDRGQTAVEYIGFLPFLILIGIVVIQLGMAAYAIQQAGTASRTAARIASHNNAGDPVAAGRAAVSDWIRDGTQISMAGGSYDAAKATARVEIPKIIPWIDFAPIERSATMPRD
ncbi:TadE family protein [Streptomyces sp. NPDC058280]|uniref:TadE family protein n=1 Tax=Streptomyces sp. NPDC058280 TaxID=3346419 RepID=UPI0036E70D5E